MGQYFDDIHALKGSQLEGGKCEVHDTPEIELMRKNSDTPEGACALAGALRNQLRYREIPEICTPMTLLYPKDVTFWRLRAGAFLTTLQYDSAVWDFLQCLTLGADKQDIYYRLGLCRYFQGSYLAATVHFEDTFSISGDEMGIAAIYWHTLSAARAELPTILLPFYHKGMEVGHHTAYEKAVSLWAGFTTDEALFSDLNAEEDELEYVIAAYGLAVYYQMHGAYDKYKNLIKLILSKDSYWSALSYLAAYNDAREGGYIHE